jgi:hypothetical protein
MGDNCAQKGIHCVNNYSTLGREAVKGAAIAALVYP